MIIGLKDGFKLFGITIVACCAAFVCTLFLSYNVDLSAIKGEITTEAGLAMYDAQVMMGRVIAGVSGGCLIATSVVMLLFYVKNYVAAHGKELGVLKALGYSDIKIAKSFTAFGLSVLVGCVAGFAAGWLYLPAFYRKQNPQPQELLRALKATFHPLLAFSLTCAPAVVFAGVAVLFAYAALKTPVLNLIREKRDYKTKPHNKKDKDMPFLRELSAVTLKSKKTLVFFVAFSAFCFSAMVQMSYSMNTLASETFAVMVLAIGLILAFVTLLLSLSAVVKENAKTIAVMRAFGYEDSVTRRRIFGAYRPVACIGFVVGTAYQYGLLRLMVTVVFSGIKDVPKYDFNVKALIVTAALFVVAYELSIYLFSLRIKRLSIKNVMTE